MTEQQQKDDEEFEENKFVEDRNVVVEKIGNLTEKYLSTDDEKEKEEVKKKLEDAEPLIRRSDVYYSTCADPVKRGQDLLRSQGRWPSESTNEEVVINKN